MCKDSELCCNHECRSLSESCEGFPDDELWIGLVFALSAMTDVGQIVIAICYHKTFFHRLTWTSDNEGFCYRNFTKHFEKCVHWISRGIFGRWQLRGKNFKELIQHGKLKMKLWSCMFVSLALGFLQRLFDLPYVDLGYFHADFLGNGCNFIDARHLTKPREFYILFLFAEFYGLWVFWYCAKNLKEDIKNTGVDLSLAEFEDSGAQIRTLRESRQRPGLSWGY